MEAGGTTSDWFLRASADLSEQARVMEDNRPAKGKTSRKTSTSSHLHGMSPGGHARHNSRRLARSTNRRALGTIVQHGREIPTDSNRSTPPSTVDGPRACDRNAPSRLHSRRRSDRTQQ